MSFPYIQKLIVHDCYAYQNLTIDTGVQEEGQFKHIILTGPNGSGKTTILERINRHINELYNGIDISKEIIDFNLGISKKTKKKQKYTKEDIFDLESITLILKDGNLLEHYQDIIIMAYFDSIRDKEFVDVDFIGSDDFKDYSISNNDFFHYNIKQYFINKKIYQAFDIIDSNAQGIAESQRFFDNFTNILRRIFHDPALELEFQRDNFEFFLRHSNGRRITFNQLSDGFSAFLSILMDLLMRTDLIRKEKGDYSYDPEGFVLIDEPETHLHLSMQYEVLPLINTLFPRLQLIVATHSPAVISSLKNAIVYDLGSQKTVSSDELVASSFSELMVRHFGLDNEFSNIADDILKQTGEAIKAKDTERLKQVLAENERYLTPSLRLELESQLILMQNRMTAA